MLDIDAVIAFAWGIHCKTLMALWKLWEKIGIDGKIFSLTMLPVGWDKNL
jgi:hypothetical protein